MKRIGFGGSKTVLLGFKVNIMHAKACSALSMLNFADAATPTLRKCSNPTGMCQAPSLPRMFQPLMSHFHL